MPERDWRQKPARHNARVSKYCKDGVSVILVRPTGGTAFVLARSRWGPWTVMDTDLPKDPDLEDVRQSYLFRFPEPLAPSSAPSIYTRLRRPEL